MPAGNPHPPPAIRDVVCGRRYILTVGRRDPYKNHVGLIRSFARVREMLREDVALVFVGARDPRYTEAEREASRLHLIESVHFTDHLDDDALAAAYAHAAAFVLPSLYEGFGLPPLEAMLYGTPVISSNRTCLPEVLGDAAVLADPESIDDFAGAIARVMSDEALSHSLSERGRKRAQQFPPARQARETLAVYDMVMNQFG